MLFSFVSLKFQFPNYCHLPCVWRRWCTACANTLLESPTYYGQYHPCPLRSPVAHSPTSESIRKSPTSLASHTPLYCATSWLGFRRPEGYSISRPPRLSEFPERKNLRQHQDWESMNSSTWLSELMCQAPESSPHAFCRNVRATWHTIAIEGYTGTFETLSHPCTHSEVSALYSHGMSAQEQVCVAHSRYQPFILTGGLWSL